MNLAPIGYFSRTHGTRGHVVLKEEVEVDVESLKVVFIEISGSRAPYFVQEYKFAGKDVVLLLEGIDRPELAKGILNKPVLADETLLLDEEEEDWTGFELMESAIGSMGQVLEVSSNGLQSLLHLNFKDREVILPVTKDFLLRVDKDKKLIFYKAPEGLVDLYLSEE